jgi:NitT/TauT family transport system substrate-binding protein
MKHLALVARLVLALALLGATQPLNPPVKVIMANSDSTMLIGIYIALERGYFRDEGLDVDFVNNVSAPEQIAQLAAGHIQFGYGGPEPGLFNAVNRGIDIKLIAPLPGYGKGNAAVAFLVRQDLIDSGRYKSLKDLKGMNVAVITPTSAQYYLHLLLQKVGLDIPDVNPVYMGFSDMVTAFASKRIDAAEVAEPAITRLLDTNAAKDVLPLGDLTPNIRPLSLLASPVFIRENPEAVRRFLIAYIRGNLDYWHAFIKRDRPGDQADLIRIMTKYTRLTDPKVYEEMLGHHGFIDVNPTATVDRPTLEDIQAYYIKQGTELQHVDISKLVDDSFMRDALKRLGGNL